ncbi:MAG: 1-hydroxycarotenoid 3,4-desaturase CrtD [Hyphomicrobiaceae bacterium]
MHQSQVNPKVVVIGAGIGGLVAALSLASHGLDVTVVERAEGPGGKIRTTLAGQRPIDCGPTVLTMRDVFALIFQEAGADLTSLVPMQRAEILARHAWGPGEQFDLHADRQRSFDAIAEFATPAEAKRYAAFCDRAQRVFHTLDYPFMRTERPSVLGLVKRVGLSRLGALAQISPFTTLWQELERSFHDPRLRQLFGRYATYCGSSPFRAPATLMLIAHAEQQGVWLVEGGMHKLSHALAALVGAKGARIAYRAEARSIMTKGARINGVQLATGEELAADIVVVNADIAAISSGRFGPAIADGAPRMVRGNRSLSAFTLALETVASGFPLVRHNVFFSRDYAAEFAHIGAGRVPTEPTVYVCAQDRGDKGAAPDGNGERLFCIINAPPNGDAIQMNTTEIDKCVANTINQLGRCGMTINTSRTDITVTTPADFERLFPATGGSLYGQATHGWRSSFLRQGTRGHLPGLYLAGGSVHPGAGVPMAAISGRLAASAVMADLASTNRWYRVAMPGGMSTR